MSRSVSEERGSGGSRLPYPNPFWTRVASLLMAMALSTLILVYPRVIAENAGEIRHGLLPLLMWGIVCGFVHGVGFVPRATVWRLLFHPGVGWPLMASGILWIASVAL